MKLRNFFASLLLLTTLAVASFGQSAASANQFVYFHGGGEKPPVIHQKTEMLPDFVNVAQMDPATGALTPLSTVFTGNFSAGANDQTIAAYTAPNGSSCLFTVSGSQYFQTSPYSTYIESFTADTSTGATTLVGVLLEDTNTKGYIGGNVFVLGNYLYFAPFAPGFQVPLKAYSIGTGCVLSAAGTSNDAKIQYPAHADGANIGGYDTFIVPNNCCTGYVTLYLYLSSGGNPVLYDTYNMTTTGYLGGVVWNPAIEAFVASGISISSHQLQISVIRVLQGQISSVTTTTFSQTANTAGPLFLMTTPQPTLYVSDPANILWQFAIATNGAVTTLGQTTINPSSQLGEMSSDHYSNFLVAPEFNLLGTGTDFYEFVIQNHQNISGSPFDFGWHSNGGINQWQNSVSLPLPFWAPGN